jgi:hypothetical protein
MKTQNKIPQFELPPIDTAVFNLVIEQSLDGERLHREMEAAALRIQESEEIEKKQQPNLI